MSPVTDLLASRLQHLWYGGSPYAEGLRPLAFLFKSLVKFRRSAYAHGYRKAVRLPVPVIVVGNISVGGTGKTPLVIWLVRFLAKRGYRPGVISRGYGGKAADWPQHVCPDSDPYAVGDEAVLLSRSALCPVCVGPDRVAAGRALLAAADCDLVITDDGLQHYRLARDIEIAVIDGERRFGNALCLPAGPLREPVERLQDIDLVVCHGRAPPGEYEMSLVGGIAVNLEDPGQRRTLAAFAGSKLHALAGIGNPERFFAHLRRYGLAFDTRVFPDHHAYQPSDLTFHGREPVLMTEKDAVKCRPFAKAQHWYVPVQAKLEPAFGERLLTLLRERCDGYQTA
jgi:tetraacyldisaccharide 4'-kinase